MSNLETLADLFEEEIKDIYSAENQLLKALPKLAKKASNKSLKDAFLAHAEETKGQIDRLEQIGKNLEIKLTGKVCKAMQGLVEEGKEVLEEESDNPALIDLMLITAAQKCEHYEISGYGTLCAIGTQLGYDDEVALLKETLDEESATDEKLTQITEDEVMTEASGSEDDNEEEEEGDSEEDDQVDAKPAKKSASKAPSSKSQMSAKGRK